jgi:hypothetical protein
LPSARSAQGDGIHNTNSKNKDFGSSSITRAHARMLSYAIWPECSFNPITIHTRPTTKQGS